MISDSAWVAMLQLWPALSSACDIVAKPRPSAVSFSTSGASACWYSVSQLAPWKITTLWLKPSCGCVGAHGFDGSNSTAIRYSSRSIAPVSSRTMNGTVLPWSVVVLLTSLGGLSGSYGCSPPPPVGLYWYEYDTGRLHWASTAPAKHVHGLICGPAITGPPIGWLRSFRLAARPPGANAVTVWAPLDSPVSRPR